MLKSFALIWHDLVSLSGAARTVQGAEIRLEVMWRYVGRFSARRWPRRREGWLEVLRGTCWVSRNNLATWGRRGASRKWLRKLWRPGPENWGYWREREQPALFGSPEEVSRPCSDIRKSVVLTGCNWNVGTGTQKTSGREAGSTAIDRQTSRSDDKSEDSVQLFGQGGVVISALTCRNRDLSWRGKQSLFSRS